MNQPSHANLRTRLEASRQELLDLGLRNSLLNYRYLRSKGVEIVDEKAIEICRLIVTERKSFTFLPIDDDQGLYTTPADDAGQPGLLAERHTDTKLQTSLNSKQLHNRLLATYYAAHTYIEEQGVNILFLALGVLRWYETDDSDKSYRAPLLLIPVELERSNARERFHLRHSDEEIGGNISLAAKLRADFGLKYPDFPDVEDFDINAYFDSISTCVESKSSWVVERDIIVLGFFSFGKYLMYRDLDPKSWPDAKCPTDHPILQALLDENGFFDAKSPYSESEPVDSYLTAREVFHILDADSTQTLALLDAADGRNIIIQGPPGTGKSQTIANLIADAVGNNKKVLFVAEKMAALNVVKKRLDATSVGDACLELHSNKIKKKNVLAEIRRTLELGKPRLPQIEAELSLLAQTRDRINSYCDAVNNPVGKSGVAPVDAFGHLVRLTRKLQTVECPPVSIDGIRNWSATEYAHRTNIIDELEGFIKSKGIPKRNPFWGSKRTVFLPSEKPRLQLAIRRVLEGLRNLTERIEEVASHLKISPPIDSASVEKTLTSFRRVYDAPCPPGVQVDSPRWLAEREQLDKLVNAGRTYAIIHKRYDDCLLPESWNYAATEAQKRLLPYRNKWWRLLASEYRRYRKEVACICRAKPPRSLSQILELLAGIHEHQVLSDEIRRGQSLLKELFGPLWKGFASDWHVLSSAYEWIATLRTDIGKGITFDWTPRVLGAGIDRDYLKSRSQELDRALREYTSALKELCHLLDFDPALIQSCVSECSFGTLNQIFSKWLESLDLLSDLVVYNLYRKKLQEEKLEALIPIAESLEPAPNCLKSLFDRLWFESLVEWAFAERPALAQFDGTSHEQLVEKFRKLDELQLQYNRAKLALSHWNRLPTSSGEGQLGVLKREFEKKRRHLPLRKLMENAGNAIQAIKPVFMMSPLSIANFLPPESTHFDLVVFDEASQVKPVDAWGAILRGNQVVVVGDSKQLPPTNFFDTISSEEDLDETNIAADIESILGLFASRGAHQRMLRWHYRSRHESLIAISNKEFYDFRLVVFPSPQNSRDELGLSFHHLPNTSYDRGRTRTNQGEALKVAEAVMAHARAQIKQRADQRQTLGVAAFSFAQTEAILDQLEKLRRQDSSCEEFFNYNQFEPFFVKNLENVQGDERDVIFISVGYGRTAEEFIAMDFGPLNRPGGERRLNVLITRARLKCEVFTNLTADDIDLERTSSIGVKCLKSFLAYAQNGYLEIPTPTDREPDSPFETEVLNALGALGHSVHPQVGCAGFFIDLAVVDPTQSGRYLLGIECDGASYHRARSARDRDRLRQAVLESLGWRIHRIWSTDWYRNPERELKRAVEAINLAMISRTNSNPSKVETNNPGAREQNMKPNTIERNRHYSDDHRETIQEYETASPSFDLGSTQLHEVNPRVLGPWVVKVLKTESPLHVNEVMRRVATSAGVARVGNRIQNAFRMAFRSAADAGLIRKSGDFLWLKDMTVPPLRNRSNLPPASKRLEWVAPEEIDLAIQQVVRKSYGMTDEQVPQAACGLLGFDRVSDDMRSLVGNRVQVMLQDGRLVRKGTHVMVPESNHL